MRHGLIWVMGVWIFTTASVNAQPPAPPPPFFPPDPVPLLDPPGGERFPMDIAFTPGSSPAPFRYWLRVDYLLWWMKDGPLPIPVVTTGDPNDALPGAIGQPGTQLLMGNSSFHFRDSPGVRLVLGGWCDPVQNIGIEGNVFALARRSKAAEVSSDISGNPLLALPYFSQTPGATGENALVIANPGIAAGDIFVSSSIRIWGTEVNGIFRLWREPGFEFSLLAGFRYAELQENVSINSETISLVPGPSNVVVLNDYFSTRNQFYGGQIGARVSWQWNRLSLDATGKLALGSTHQVVDISGDSTVFGTNPATFASGLYTQPSNIGRYTADQFTVMPSLELKLGYQITPRCRVSIGYDLLYWNQVVRPGSQIDRNVNLSQSAILGTTGGVLTGPAQPSPLFNRSDFWTQGLNLGFEFRF